MSEYRYKAFISYSHADEAWARWLHRSIEAYRVPHKLVGSKTAVGEVPARIKPIFRDRDELSSAVDLGSTVKQALSDSENLIVVCSPAGAASMWVREEIREFVRLGRKDRIFCVITDGEASASGSVATLFPDAIAEAGMQEPLAADVRKWADGKHLAKLKLIAGLLDLPLDQLRRRELHKRRKTLALMLAASVAVLAIVVIAITARMAAEQRRDSGELLVGYKLNELRTMLKQAGDPEKLERLQEWSTDELTALILGAGPGTTNLATTAQRQRTEGIEQWDAGDMTTSLETFKTSWALLAEIYRRDRNNQEALFELGQAEFWIGQTYLDRGETDLAESAFLSYAEITRRLIQMQPKNAEWVLEMAYALTNLGAVEKAREAINPEHKLQYMQSALEYNQIALVLDPENEYYRSELGQSHANLADAQRDVCDLDGALQSRSQGLALETKLFQDDGENPERLEDLASALSGYARVQALLGNNDEAIANFEKSIQLIEQSARPDELNRTARDHVMIRNRIIWLDAMSGRIDKAWAGSESLADDWRNLLESGLDNVSTLITYDTTYLLDRAWLANERDDTGLATDLLEQGLALLETEAIKLPHNRQIGNTLTLAAYRYWQIRGELPPDNILSLLPDYRANSGRTRSCLDASLSIRKEVMLGNPAKADDLAAYLLDSGFRETGFIQICRLYYGCSGETDPN
ncbi:MAG: TIR domain-containing protein [Xanthomonadales bacterium]|nr:TIR domain-containing protein [Xanthomonadales bacterium]